MSQQRIRKTTISKSVRQRFSLAERRLRDIEDLISGARAQVSREISTRGRWRSGASDESSAVSTTNKTDPDA